MSNELTEDQFGELYDSLAPEEPISAPRWHHLTDDERRVVRALYDLAENKGYDAGHAQGEQDGYKAAEAALREDAETTSRAAQGTPVPSDWLCCVRCGGYVERSFAPGDCFGPDCEPQHSSSHDEAKPYAEVHGDSESADLGALPWRAGTKNLQTVYDANERQVASAQTGELAAYIVRAVNADPLEQIAFTNTLTPLRKAIEKVAESLENASGNPHISGADDRALKWAAEKIRGVLK